MQFTATLAALVATASAFPNMAALMAQKRGPELEKRFQELNAIAQKHEARYFGNTGMYAYVAPKLDANPPDMRGPCPGLNTLANHGYLPHDGIPNAAQLIAGQMNGLNIAPDLAALLVAVAMPLDGDIITTKLSIGGDATSRTAALGSIQNVLGKEGGLIVHNTFEADSSLTRNDVFTSRDANGNRNGDNYNFNATLWKQMTAVAQKTSGGLYDQACLTQYRYDRYYDSRRENPDFYFGPKALLLYGASAFVFHTMAGAGQADVNTISSFFGVDPANPQNHRSGVGEHFPDNWKPTPVPYTILEIAGHIGQQYLAKPVEFGGNANGTFEGVGLNGATFSIPPNATPQTFACLLEQVIFDNYPSMLSGIPALTTQATNYMSGLLKQYGAGSAFAGCPKVPGQPIL